MLLIYSYLSKKAKTHSSHYKLIEICLTYVRTNFLINRILAVMETRLGKQAFLTVFQREANLQLLEDAAAEVVEIKAGSQVVQKVNVH